MATFDVAVFRTNRIYVDDLIMAEPEIRERTELGHELSIEPLPQNLLAKIVAAYVPVCMQGAPDNTRTLYAFIRRTTAPSALFDSDGTLAIALALSRLVHPTSIGLEESARVVTTGSGLTFENNLSVSPGLNQGPASMAWVIDESQRDWLTASDGLELTGLVDRYFAEPLTGSLLRALWHHEFAARNSDMAIRWAIVVTGLESLINTGEPRVARQFTERVTALAEGCGLTISPSDVADAYRQRSKVVHGHVVGYDAAKKQLYREVEEILGAAISKALLDHDWRSVFDNKATVKTRWPVDTTVLCPHCGLDTNSRAPGRPPWYVRIAHRIAGLGTQ